MKSIHSAASFLVLTGLIAIGLRASAPAQGQGTQRAGSAQEGSGQGLEARVATLESELALEKKRHEETRALLEQTLGYLEKQSKAAETLLGVLAESEKEGFAVGENWRSRELLLAGFRAYWGEQQAPPKPPTPAPPKPAAPTRPTRPVRQ